MENYENTNLLITQLTSFGLGLDIRHIESRIYYG